MRRGKIYTPRRILYECILVNLYIRSSDTQNVRVKSSKKNIWRSENKSVEPILCIEFWCLFLLTRSLFLFYVDYITQIGLLQFDKRKIYLLNFLSSIFRFTIFLKEEILYVERYIYTFSPGTDILNHLNSQPGIRFIKGATLEIA